MKTLRARTFSDFRQTLAQIFISSRTGKEWMAQRAQIQSGASHQHGHMTPRFNLTNCLQRVARPINRGESYDRRNKIDQVMRNAATLFEGDLGSGNFDLLINLN